MSYLDLPRLHFAGRFLADPSTEDNNPNNFDPRATFSSAPNDPYYVLWNPGGSHVFQFVDATVRSVADAAGTIHANGSADPLIGASVETTDDPYPAKL